jgi:hypothetical protein
MRLLFILEHTSVTRLGVEFPHNGDAVIWLWPWQRDGKPKFISLGFTGTGEWGDARYNTLAESDRAWAGYFDAEAQKYRNPPCGECGAMTPDEAATKCNCAGDKDHCHGCELWPN